MKFTKRIISPGQVGTDLANNDLPLPSHHADTEWEDGNDFSDNNTFFKSESSDTDEEAIGPKGKVRRRGPVEKLSYHISMEEFTASLSVLTQIEHTVKQKIIQNGNDPEHTHALNKAMLKRVRCLFVQEWTFLKLRHRN